MKRLLRAWRAAAHAINDPIPGEKWIVALIILLWLLTLKDRL